MRMAKEQLSHLASSCGLCTHVVSLVSSARANVDGKKLSVHCDCSAEFISVQDDTNALEKAHTRSAQLYSFPNVAVFF